MAIIRSVRGFSPEIGKDCFLADNAVIIGDVVIGDECSIWFSTVLRGDVNSIRIGNRVNVQDGSVLHTLYQKSTIEIGDDVSIGHNVVVHGAKIRDYALIGMGAVVMAKAPSSPPDPSCSAARKSVPTNFGAVAPRSSSRWWSPPKPRR